MVTQGIELEVFGTPDQQAMMRKGMALRQLTKDDPRFSYYGRNVALTAFSSDAIETVVSLSKLQGTSSCLYVPVKEVESFASSLAQRSFAVDQFELWRGENEALVASKATLAQRQLPDDLEIININPDTPTDIMAALDKVTASCGVLLPFGDVMRGLDSPTVCMLAVDRNGTPIASAASVAFNHQDNVHGKDAWWGMLATHEDRRGEGIAIVLGAMAILSMNERHGSSAFITGVCKGNVASEKLCQKLGLSAGHYGVVTALDPKQFPGGRMTK